MPSASRSPYYLFQCLFVRETSKAGCAIILTNRHFKWGDNSAIFSFFGQPLSIAQGRFAAHYHSFSHLAYMILVGEIYGVRLEKNRFARLPFVFLTRGRLFVMCDI